MSTVQMKLLEKACCVCSTRITSSVTGHLLLFIYLKSRQKQYTIQQEKRRHFWVWKRISLKMPFIWNDETFEFVDDSTAYIRNEFVVVRKLFVQFKTDAKVGHIICR